MGQGCYCYTTLTPVYMAWFDKHTKTQALKYGNRKCIKFKNNSSVLNICKRLCGGLGGACHHSIGPVLGWHGLLNAHPRFTWPDLL